MQLFDLHPDHFNVYCQATGECVFEEDSGLNQAAPSLFGYWFAESWDEPIIMNSKLIELWNAFETNNPVKRNDLSFYPSQYIDAFFASVKMVNVIVLKRTFHDPFNTHIDYIVLDLDCELQDI